MEINKNKLYSKEEILDILNNILKKCKNKDYQLALKYVDLFQKIIWEDNDGKDLYFDLNNEEENCLQDLAIDLDYYGVNVSDSDINIGIKDLNFEKDRLIFMKEIGKSIEVLKNE